MDIFFPYGQAILPLKVSGRKPEDNGCIYGLDYEWKNILRVYIRKSIRIRLDLQNRHFSRWDIGFAIQEAAANMTAAFCRFDRLNHGLRNSVHDNRKFAKRAGCCLHGGHMGLCGIKQPQLPVFFTLYVSHGNGIFFRKIAAQKGGIFVIRLNRLSARIRMMVCIAVHTTILACII